MKYLLAIILLLGIFGCEEEEVIKFEEKYDGPVLIQKNIVAHFSDSAEPMIMLKSAYEEDHANGDTYFKNGLYIEMYDEDGSVKSSITSNEGQYIKEKDLYTCTGAVVVENLKEYKKLNTEVLNWNPKEKKIFTDKFVTITTKEELIKGTGLDASQDFSQYKMRKVSGIFSINQDE